MADLFQHIINGLASGTVYALVALGYTMVYGVLKLINFAHGDVMMVGVYTGYATATTMGRDNASTFGGVTIVFLVSMATCATLGFLIERFAYRPLREKPRLVALTFMLGSTLAAGAGILYAIKDTLVQPLMGAQVGLKAFVAAVIGGIGHVPGAVVGALLLGLVEELVVGYGSSTWRDAVAF